MGELEILAKKYIFKVRNPSRNILTMKEVLERIEKPLDGAWLYDIEIQIEKVRIS